MYKYKNNNQTKAPEYQKIWWNSKTVIDAMKKSEMYNNWRNDTWVIFEEFINKFSLNVQDINSAFSTSLINRVANLKENWIWRDTPDITPYIHNTITDFDLDNNLMKIVFPTYFGMVKRETLIVLQYLNQIKNKAEKINSQNIFEILYDKFNNEKNSLFFDANDYFNNPEKLIALSEKERNYFWDEWLACHMYFNNLHLFEIRYGMIQNLFKKSRKGGKLLSEMLNFNQITKEKLVFFIPVLDVEEKHEDIFQINQEIMSGCYLIKFCTEFEIGELIKNRQRLLNFDIEILSSPIDIKREIYYIEPQEKIESIEEFVEDVNKNWKDNNDYYPKKYKIEDKLSDFIPSFVQNLKSESSAIKKIIIDDINVDQKMKLFILKSVDALFSFKENNNQIDIFLSYWLVIESVRVYFTSETNFNKAIKDTVSKICRYKLKNIDDKKFNDFLEEMVMFRNTLIHGSIPNKTRVGSFNLVLSTAVSILLNYTIQNYVKFSKISFPDFLTILKFDV